ncbi:MAG: CYTH domain-containing protein [Oscillospiraceae bacterium]|nr:CYTH domain-containing protein [Oscillospiraceae bacterium]
MEIERKWLIDAFPTEFELIEEAEMEQGYISVKPVVRIRKRAGKKGTDYILCIKGKGTLVREEIETPISQEVYEKLKAFIGVPLVRKTFKVYRLPTGHALECSIVDDGEETSFMYAEVEFASVEEANAFVPPACLGAEKTEDHSFSMSDYWRAKAERYQKENQE